MYAFMYIITCMDSIVTYHVNSYIYITYLYDHKVIGANRSFTIRPSGNHTWKFHHSQMNLQFKPPSPDILQPAMLNDTKW